MGAISAGIVVTASVSRLASPVLWSDSSGGPPPALISCQFSVWFLNQVQRIFFFAILTGSFKPFLDKASNELDASNAATYFRTGER